MQSRSFLIVITLYFTLIIGCGIQYVVPERPENVTSSKIQKPEEETYNLIIESLKSREFKIDKKNKFNYIEASKEETTVLTLGISGLSGKVNDALIEVYSANVWLETLSENYTQVYIQVIEKSYEIENSKFKKESEKISRVEYLERGIISDLE